MFPPGLTLLTAGAVRLPCEVIRRPGGNTLHSPAGGSDLVGAWLEAPSLSCPTVGSCVPALLISIERTGMTTLASQRVVVIGGVDTHADVHVAAACDQLGGVLGTASFPTTTAGYRSLLRFLRSFGQLVQVGVEGTGSYGSGLARHLADHDVVVVEVNRPNRQARRAHGKTDTVDAIAAARAVISGQARSLPSPTTGRWKRCGRCRRCTARRHKARTQALNQLHALVLTAPDPIREPAPPPASTASCSTTCAGYRPGRRRPDRDHQARAARARRCACGDLDAQIRRARAAPPPAGHRDRARRCWPSTASAPTPPPRCC